MTCFPPGFLVHIGGVVSARSVKLLDKIHNPGELRPLLTNRCNKTRRCSTMIVSSAGCRVQFLLAFNCRRFLYARHLTDVLWYGAVCPSVRRAVRMSERSVIHNPCGQDIARTIQPRLLKLRMYTSYGKRKKSINF